MATQYERTENEVSKSDTRNEEQGKVDGSYKTHTERVLSLGPESQQFTAGFNNVVVSRVVSLAMAPDTMETLLDATFTRI